LLYHRDCQTSLYPLALTVAFPYCLYFVSLTVIPVLSAKYLHPETEDMLPFFTLSGGPMKWRLRGWFEQIDSFYQFVLAGLSLTAKL